MGSGLESTLSPCLAFRKRRLSAIIREAGGNIDFIDGPPLFPEIGPGDEALTFEDPFGNRLEPVHRTD